MLATPERAEQLKDHPLVISSDINCLESTYQIVSKFAQDHQLQYVGITTFICESMEVTAELAMLLELPFHDSAAVFNTRNKAQTWALWNHAGVSTPESCQVSNIDDLVVFSDRVPGPWILKPCSGSGSEWVLRVDDSTKLPLSHQRMADRLSSHRNVPIPYIVQQFIEGREFSADLMITSDSMSVLRLTEKYLVPCAGHAGHVGAYFPGQVSEDDFCLMKVVFDRGVKALGIERGIVMVDAILTDTGFYLLEMALRPGGDCLPDFCLYSSGYDPIKAACNLILGHNPAVSFNQHEINVAGLHLTSDWQGVVTAIDFRRLSDDPAVLHVSPYCGVGDRIASMRECYGNSILAACIAHYNNPKELPILIERLTQLIDISIDSSPEDLQYD